MMSKKPKILSLGHSYVVSLNRSVMREIHRRGNIDVEVVAPKFFDGDLRPIYCEPEPAESLLKVHEVECFLTQRIHFFLYNPIQLKKILLRNNYDFFYLWEEPYVLAGYQVARWLKSLEIPYSIYSNQNIYKKYPWPFSYFEKKSLMNCTEFWGCGPLVEETFRRKGFVDLNYKTIPYFVNTDQFKPMQNDMKIQVKKELGFSGEKKMIGFMGRFTEEKGIDLIIKALDQLLKKNDYDFLFLGAGPCEEKIVNWIQQNGRSHQVKVRFGKHDEVPKILPAFDLLLCPSQTRNFWREQFGRMIIEAFASGVPVMASRSGEIPYVVGDAGMLLSEDRVEEWVNGVIQMLGADSQNKFKEKGISRAQNFSISSIASLIEKDILLAVDSAKRR